MNANATTLLLAGCLFATGPLRAEGIDATRLADQAVSENPRQARLAVAALRDMGPDGLEALLRRHAGTISAYRAWLERPGDGAADPAWDRLNAALNAVGAQYDNFAAGLYWHTDLERAKEAARRTGRPILSLRLLGRLDEDLSCANSRFLRTAVYADEQVAERLRDGFVLHWSSVRPVPRITIDFGDGRRVVRTITGNSLHYVLNEQGRPLDALPGLYGPRAFAQWIDRAAELHEQAARDDLFFLRTYHDTRYREIVVDWQRALDRVGRAEPLLEAAAGADDRRVPRLPRALEAAPIAVSKSAVEIGALRAMAPVADRLEASMTDDAWRDVAELHRHEARLGKTSRLVMAKKARSCTPTVIENFERTLAMDTVRNEFLLHRVIHGWFARGRVGDLPALTERIYGELFLTPSADPWLGLVPADTYAAIDGGGLAR